MLIRILGAVERYNTALCTVPLDMNPRPGLATYVYKLPHTGIKMYMLQEHTPRLYLRQL
jgi:hypothetical protein